MLQTATATLTLDWSFLVLGALLLAASPAAERFAGQAGAVSTLLAGYLTLAVCFIFAELVTQSFVVALLAGSLLGWSAGVYVLYQLRPESKPPLSDWPADHCVPKLIYGSSSDYSDHRWTFRTRLTVRFDVKPTDCQLAAMAWASGRAFYGLYFTSEDLDLAPYLQIICSKTSDGNCRPLVDLNAATERQESPVSLQVKYDISEKDDEVTVRVTMTASVGASGGSIGVGAGGVSGSVGLTGAGLTFQKAMGTFRWRCEREPSK